MEGALFNPEFLGSKFLWWVGQVADDRTWRTNQDPHGGKDPKKRKGGYGYRYKVRIMGLHDQDEESVPSDHLPWAQVMYPITAGGGQGGSRQTPAIRQGNFVFGFFLDGQDQQLPIIMGIMGTQGKTNVEDTKTGKDSKGRTGTPLSSRGGGRSRNNTKNFSAQSGWANSDKDKTKICPKEQVNIGGDKTIWVRESTDDTNQKNAATEQHQYKLDEEHALACPDPLHESETKNIDTINKECAKKIQRLEQANENKAKAMGIPVNLIGKTPEACMKDATGEISGHAKTLNNKVQQITQEKFIEKTTPILNLSPPAEMNKLAQEQIDGLNEIACAFNGLNAGLAGLIGAALMNSFKKKKKQRAERKNAAVGVGTTAPGNTRENIDKGVTETFVPIVNDDGEIHGNWVTKEELPPNSDFIPSLPPEGFYSPSPICSTEELMAEVLGKSLNTITTALDSATTRFALAANEGLLRAGSSDGNSILGTSDTPLIDNTVSQSNVTKALGSGALVGSMAGILATASGVDKNKVGSVSDSWKSGDYSSGLESMLRLAGSAIDSGGGLAALNAMKSGDFAGAFAAASGVLGVDSGMMSQFAGAFSAIQGGDMSSLTGAIQGLAGFDPSMLSSLGGLTSGLDALKGLGALGGGGVPSISEATNFVQSVTKLYECDPDPECSPNDVHTLGSGGSGQSDMNMAQIDQQKKDEEDKAKEYTPQTKQVPIINRRGRVTGYRTVEV